MITTKTESTGVGHYTPGPWYLAHSKGHMHARVVYAGGERVAIANVRETPDTPHANARLIAAAPELLAALEDLVIGFGRCMKMADCGQEFIDVKLAPAFAAIAKAKGGR